MPQLLEHRHISSLEIDNIRVRRKCLENHRRYLLRNSGIASDTHVRDGTREPIVRHIFLEEYILRFKVDSVIKVRSTKDASHRIVPYHLITNRIGCNTYLGC
jgi:hypothetical protein